jgi:hypothetical protein
MWWELDKVRTSVWKLKNSLSPEPWRLYSASNMDGGGIRTGFPWSAEAGSGRRLMRLAQFSHYRSHRDLLGHWFKWFNENRNCL